MVCMNQLGVKNLTIAFTDCDAPSPGGIGDVKATAHIMNQDALPEYEATPYKLEGLSGGRVKRTFKNCTVKLDIMRNQAIPLAYYQGRAGLDIQVEHINGSVFTATGGAVTDFEASDSNSVSFTAEFGQLTEILPPGATLN